MRLSLGLSVVLLSALTACVTPDPKRATTDQAPTTPAAKTVTSFTPALKCMDRLFKKHGIDRIGITTAGIPDSTGKVQAGTRDMLINAVNKMVVVSNAFEYVDYDFAVNDLQFVFGDVEQYSEGRPLPAYYIRGAITQMDDGMQDSQVGGGIALPFADVGASKDQTVSVVSLDMSIGDTARRTILPGMSTSNSIAVVRSGKSADAGGKIGKVGLSFNISLGRQEGLGASVRSLMELSLIEVLGKLTNVPYWKCLEIDKTNPLMRADAQDWYDKMEPEEARKFVQAKLSALGYYPGEVNGMASTDLTRAIAEFQSRNSLIADGRINFDLYYTMLDQDTDLSDAKNADVAVHNLKTGYVATAPAPEEAPVEEAAALGLDVTTEQGQEFQLNVGQPLVSFVTTSADALVYCYYVDGAGTVARVFPNRFSPDPVVAGGQTFRLPANDEQFQILMDTPGVDESIACFATQQDIVANMPDWLKIDDLTPLEGRSLEDVAAAFSELGGASFNQVIASVQ